MTTDKFRAKLQTFIRNYGECFKSKYAKSYDYSFHALRHAGISTWIINQVGDPNYIKSIAGHSSIKITYDKYGHLFNSVKNNFDMTKLLSQKGQ